MKKITQPMKKLILLVILSIASFIPSLVYCQVTVAYDSLDINNIKALIKADGTHFHKDFTSPAAFEVPQGQGMSANFAAGLWLSGYDSLGSLHVSVGHFFTQFKWGPIADSYGMHDQIYNKVWKIEKSQIDNHIAHWSDGGYVVPLSIAEWPAHGDTSNGEAQFLAPFVDSNGNQTYDPQNGDYPKISGDQAIFYMFNDGYAGQVGLDVLGLDVLGFAYAFDSLTHPEFKNTIFLNYRIFNRSQSDYNNVMSGFWDDIDIGRNTDDLIGCDTLLNTYYGFNFNNLDNGFYGAMPPALGVTFLNHPMKGFIGYAQDTSAQGDPTTNSDFNNYLRGYWGDGTPLTYGGTGYGGGTPVKFWFPGDPVSNTGWTAFNGWDTRGVGSVGPFDFPVGGNICLDLAITYGRYGQPMNHLGGVQAMKSNVQAMTSSFLSANYGCAGGVISVDPAIGDQYVKISPNPATEMVNVSIGNWNGGIMTFECYDGLGNQIPSPTRPAIVDGRFSVDISNLNAGMYFLIINYEGKNFAKKFVKT
jgi:Secretion system C-terminal sorting domain